MEIRIEKGEDYCIAKNKVVKVIRYATSEDIEITDIQSKSDVLKSFKKLNKYEYVVVDTGEIKKYKFNNVKDVGGLKKSMKKLNQTLKNNFVGAENELFITLTAERDVTDIRQMKMMFQQWWDKLRGLYDDLEFASIYEKHIDRDSWHIHTIIKATEHKRLFIPNNIIEDVWEYGFTKTSRIVNTPTSNEIREDYRMAYRNKITERFGINKVINYMCKTETKEQIPVGIRCYDTSRGIKKPVPENISYDETRQQMGKEYKLTDAYTSLIRDGDTNVILNKVKTEHWTKIK